MYVWGYTLHIRYTCIFFAVHANDVIKFGFDSPIKAYIPVLSIVIELRLDDKPQHAQSSVPKVSVVLCCFAMRLGEISFDPVEQQMLYAFDISILLIYFGSTRTHTSIHSLKMLPGKLST